MHEKMERSMRAKQFLPFDSLKGFYDLVIAQEKIKTPRRKITVDEAERINNQIIALKEGMMVIVTYYDVDGYIKCQGIISFIDYVMKTIKIIDLVIPIKDIIDVKIIESNL